MVEVQCLQVLKIVHHYASSCFDWLISGHQSFNPSKEAISILSGKYKGFTFVHLVILERLRNENENKTKKQITQSFNQYSENETKIWRQNIRNQFNRVSSSCLRSHFVISLFPTKIRPMVIESQAVKVSKGC